MHSYYPSIRISCNGCVFFCIFQKCYLDQFTWEIKMSFNLPNKFLAVNKKLSEKHWTLKLVINSWSLIIRSSPTGGNFFAAEKFWQLCINCKKLYWPLLFHTIDAWKLLFRFFTINTKLPVLSKVFNQSKKVTSVWFDLITGLRV